MYHHVAVVTGASAGVGRAIVRKLARPGTAIGLIARGQGRLDETAAEVRALGATALVLPTDVADAHAVDVAAERVEMELGPIDVWINDAMVSVFAPVSDTTPEEFARVTAVTYLGTVHGTQAALRFMRPRDRGTIVQVGSALAYRGIPLQGAYCAAKHAVQGFMDTLRTELRHDGCNVHVTMVQLPAVNTPQFEWSRSRMPRKAQPVPPIFEPEVAADAVVWAASQRRRTVYVGWPTYKAIWGNNLVPKVADWVLSRSGYESQQARDPEDPARPDNLFAPVDVPYKARGRFSGRAHGASWTMVLTRHRLVTGILTFTVALAGLARLTHVRHA